MLATALLCIKSATGRAATVRALIDPCSETSIVSESIVQSLRLPRYRDDIAVDGLGGARTANLRHATEFNISPRSNPNISVYVNAHILQRITSYKPIPFTPGSHPDLQDLDLADPDLGRPLWIEVLIGADVYSEILLPGLIFIGNTRIIAQRTIFGWILTGKTHEDADTL